jgi:cobalt-zinc-cadmium efflux system outer membrane protein
MGQGWLGRWLLLGGVLSAGGLAGLARAGDAVTLPPLVVPARPLTLPAPRPTLSLEEAVRLALERNPELAAFRQQRGIAAAAVVIARQYPFNPIYESKIASNNGPTAAGILNRCLQEYRVVLELEVRGQGTYRRQAAQAGLTRTEWEVAAQEVKLAGLVVLAFQEMLYRREKLRLADERLVLAEQTAQFAARLREAGKLGPADVILARADIADARAARQPALLALTKARAGLRRALGVVGDVPEPDGSLEGPALTLDPQALLQTALERRPDLRAKAAAVAEAAAKLRLEVANRFGNPSLGPSYDVDPSSVSSYGAQMIIPIPALNTHRGEIQMKEAERAKAALDLRQTEVLVRQDVQGALARLAAARTWVYTYQSQLLPELRRSLADINKLFAAATPGVDVLRVVSVRRSLVTAQDAYLDALWELDQARADLIAAVGDPAVVLGPAFGPPGAGACPPALPH